MAGISSNALLGNSYPENKRKFTNQLLDDDLDLDWYQFRYRTMDPQIGRFLQVDPIADKYVYNSTFAYAENKVTQGIDLEGLELLPFNSAWFKAAADYKTYNEYGNAKIWRERVDVVTANVPENFRDASGAPLFSATSVNVGPTGAFATDKEVGSYVKEDNNLPRIPGWPGADTDPEPTNNTAGGRIGSDLDDNRAFADRASARAAILQESKKRYDIYKGQSLWEANYELYVNKQSFNNAVSFVGQYPMGMSTNPAMKANVVNFVNDGVLPSINMNDIKGSLQNGINIMKAGMQIMNNNGIDIQRPTMNTYNFYNRLLSALRSLERK